MSLLFRLGQLVRLNIVCPWCGHAANFPWSRWWHQHFCIPHLPETYWFLQDELRRLAPEQPYWRRPQLRRAFREP